MTFTEKYHLGKGVCCGNGCRHCPYEYIRVMEPLRSALLSQRKSIPPIDQKKNEE